MSSSGFWEAWVSMYGTTVRVDIYIYINASPTEKSINIIDAPQSRDIIHKGVRARDRAAHDMS